MPGVIHTIFAIFMAIFTGFKPYFRLPGLNVVCMGQQRLNSKPTCPVQDTQSLPPMSESMSEKSSEKSLSHFLLPAFLTTSAVFTALALPVIMFGNQRLSVEHEGKLTFEGPVSDLAAPYLGLGAIASVGLGVSGVAMQGWRKSARKSARLDHKIDNLQDRLKEREDYLRAALTSDAYLERSGLNFFLAEGTVIAPEFSPQIPFQPELTTAHTELVHTELVHTERHVAIEHHVVDERRVAVEHPLMAEARELEAMMMVHSPSHSGSSRIVKPRVTSRPERADYVADRQVATSVTSAVTTVAANPWLTKLSVVQPAVAQPEVVQPAAVQSAMAHSAAQGFISFARPPLPPVSPATTRDDSTIAKIQTLQDQLQQIVKQIEALHVNASSPALVETPWVNQRAAS
jgi:hypothetical protein